MDNFLIDLCAQSCCINLCKKQRPKRFSGVLVSLLNCYNFYYYIQISHSLINKTFSVKTVSVSVFIPVSVGMMGTV